MEVVVLFDVGVSGTVNSHSSVMFHTKCLQLTAIYCVLQFY